MEAPHRFPRRLLLPAILPATTALSLVLIGLVVAQWV
jgi:hypothetical protein